MSRYSVSAFPITRPPALFKLGDLFKNIQSIFTRKQANPTDDTPKEVISGTVSVVIPALNEAKRIAEVVQYALSDPATGEVIVVDDCSIDNTAELARAAGAQVITSSMLGKGASMHDGIAMAQYDIIVYLDGDLTGLRPNIISDLIRPIVEEGKDFVKARFGRSGGRVTELTAKPMLKLFFPELSEFSQPLGGIIAVKKSLLNQLHFEDGYGVDIGLLIDADIAGAQLAQVDIGGLEHDSQTLHSLGFMAQEVSRVILERAKAQGRLSIDQIMSIFELQRQNQTHIDRVLEKLSGCNKLVLLDMDGTITQERFVIELAKKVGCMDQLSELLDAQVIDSATRSQSIIQLFRFTHKSQFEQVARELPLRDGVIQAVNELRRRGYKVGVVSDSYFVAAEIIRRRIFADFALAHVVMFDNGVCQGALSLNAAFSHDDGCKEHPLCKSNVLRHIIDQSPQLANGQTIAIGDNLNDLCLLQQVDQGYIIEPKHPDMRQDKLIEIHSFDELTRHISQNQAYPLDTEHQV